MQRVKGPEAGGAFVRAARTHWRGLEGWPCRRWSGVDLRAVRVCREATTLRRRASWRKASYPGSWTQQRARRKAERGGMLPCLALYALCLVSAARLAMPAVHPAAIGTPRDQDGRQPVTAVSQVCQPCMPW